ncbi:MAG: hypothetical protein J3Q66DRAFT_347068 [Benniella sp.]|nr:MAG: hypothetical protein J3Q66DRAFT_347068 [Benniella sp.]
MLNANTKTLGKPAQHLQHSNNAQDRSPRYFTLVQLLMVLAAFPLQSSNPISSVSRQHGSSMAVVSPRLLTTATFATTGAWLLSTGMVAQALPVDLGGDVIRVGDEPEAPPKKTTKAPAPTNAADPPRAPTNSGGSNGGTGNTGGTDGNGSDGAPKAAPSSKPSKVGACTGNPCTYSSQSSPKDGQDQPRGATNAKGGAAVPAPGSKDDDDDKKGSPTSPDAANGADAAGKGFIGSTTMMVAVGGLAAVVAVVIGVVVARKRRQRPRRGSLVGAVAGGPRGGEEEHYMSYDSGVKRMTGMAGGRGGRNDQPRQQEQFWNP